jgi:hypothetical protein
LEGEYRVVEKEDKIVEDLDAELNSEESEDEELVNLITPKIEKPAEPKDVGKDLRFITNV